MTCMRQISFAGMKPSPAIKQDIEDRIDHLEQFYKRLTSCRVVVAIPHRHHNKGKLYEIRIDLTLPGGEVAISREAGFDHAHEDIHVALRDAFDAAKRRIEDYARRQSTHRTRHHSTPLRGKIVRLFYEDGYGFIESTQGEEYFFSRDSVTKGAWNELDVGAEVKFTAGEGQEGPYASSISLSS
jgi:ribosomal subunit interface protein